MIGKTNISGAPKPKIEIVPWQTGTDEQIVAIVQALNDGKLTVEETGWSVGDSRSVNLAAFQTYSGSTSSTTQQAAQTAQLVLMHKGGKQFSDGSNCHFVVGFKDNVCKSFWGVSDNTYQNSLCWKVEDNIYNALPSTIKPIFKQFKAITGVYSGSTYTTYNRYMCSPAEAEIFGSRSYCIQAEFDQLKAASQFDYYKTASNRIHTNIVNYWWERSPNYNYDYHACYVYSGGTANDSSVNDRVRGLAPFGCI